MLIKDAHTAIKHKNTRTQRMVTHTAFPLTLIKTRLGSRRYGREGLAAYCTVLMGACCLFEQHKTVGDVCPPLCSHVRESQISVLAGRAGAKRGVGSNPGGKNLWLTGGEELMK